MPSSSVGLAPMPSSYCYPIPKHFLHFPLKKKPNSLSPPNNQIHTRKICALTLHTANNCSSKEQEKTQRSHNNNNSHPDQNLPFFDQLYYSSSTDTSSKQNPETQNQERERQEQEEEPEYKDRNDEDFEVFFTNMGWAELKAALGQRINVEGIVSSTRVFVKDRHLALPHVSVPDIRYIDWAELKRRGFKGVVFDKDNTITAPYSLTLWGPITSSIERCKSVFGHDIAVFSNSAGLDEYDQDGSKAKTLEEKIGIKVIKHRVKKPAGTAEEIEKHFSCQSSQLIMVGDRPSTDIVYGNRNGFLTILTEALSLAEEPFIVRQVRKLEVSLVNRWLGRGLKPISHSLLPDPMKCVKDASSL